jgi:hypothetical protein
MSTLTMKPVQVYLRPEQIESLRAIAERRKVSMAELVRQGVDRLLEDVPVEEDPLWNIVGIMDGGPHDLAENHDKYLAEMVTQENREWRAKSS